MINNPISMQVDLLLAHQLTLPHAAGTKERILVQPNAVLVEPAPLWLHEKITEALLLGLLEVFDAEGTGQFAVGFAFEAVGERLLAVRIIEDLGTVRGRLFLEGGESRRWIRCLTQRRLLGNLLHLTRTIFYLSFLLLFFLLFRIDTFLLEITHDFLPVRYAL